MLIFRIITTIINALLLLIFFPSKGRPEGPEYETWDWTNHCRFGSKYTFDLELIAW